MWTSKKIKISPYISYTYFLPFLLNEPETLRLLVIT